MNQPTRELVLELCSLAKVASGFNYQAATAQFVFRAIAARVNGVYDATELVAFGPLSDSTTDDCLYIIKEGMARATTPITNA